MNVRINCKSAEIMSNRFWMYIIIIQSWSTKCWHTLMHAMKEISTKKTIFWDVYQQNTTGSRNEHTMKISALNFWSINGQILVICDTTLCVFHSWKLFWALCNFLFFRSTKKVERKYGWRKQKLRWMIVWLVVGVSRQLKQFWSHNKVSKNSTSKMKILK